MSITRKRKRSLYGGKRRKSERKSEFGFEKKESERIRRENGGIQKESAGGPMLKVPGLMPKAFEQILLKKKFCG